MEKQKYDIFLISPVRNASAEENQQINKYIQDAEEAGVEIYWPKRHNPFQKTDPIGIKIINYNLKIMRGCKQIHYWYSKGSYGSFADLQTTLALNKPLILVNKATIKETNDKSYENVLLWLDSHPKRKEKIYICAPLGGKTKQEIRDNIQHVYSYAYELALQGYYPLIPHSCAEYLNDQNSFERRLGQSISEQMIIEADEMHIIPDRNNKGRITNGMHQDIECAETNNIKTVYVKFLSPV